MNNVHETTNILENEAKYRKVTIDAHTCRHTTTPSLDQGESGQGARQSCHPPSLHAQTSQGGCTKRHKVCLTSRRAIENSDVRRFVRARWKMMNLAQADHHRQQCWERRNNGYLRRFNQSTPACVGALITSLRCDLAVFSYSGVEIRP